MIQTTISTITLRSFTGSVRTAFGVCVVASTVFVLSLTSARAEDESLRAAVVESAGIVGKHLSANGFSLNLAGTSVQDADLAELRFPHYGRVQKLKLQNTKITDKGVRYVRYLKSLIAIDLRNTAITDEGFQHLAGLRIRYLIASNTKLSDKSIGVLRQMPLEYLNVKGTKLSERGRARIKAHFSNIKIEF